MTRAEALDLVRQYTKNENLVKHMLAVEAAMVAYHDKFEKMSPNFLHSTTTSSLECHDDDDDLDRVKSVPLGAQTETNLDRQTLPTYGSEDVGLNKGPNTSPFDPQTRSDLKAKYLAPNDNKFSKEDWSICGILHDFDYEKMGHKHPSEWGYSILRKKGVSEEIIDAIKGHAKRDDPSSRRTMMAKTLFAVDELTGFIVACALVNPEKLSGLSVESVIRKFKKKDFAKGVSREDIYQGAKELEVSIEEHVQTVLDAMVGIKDELGL